VRTGVIIASVAVLLTVAAGVWVVATEHGESAAHPDVAPRLDRNWPLSGADATRVRNDALRRAQVRTSEPLPPAIASDVQEAPMRCRFLADFPSGTSPKFDCVLEDGQVVKVKYGRNPEIAAEVIATRLLSGLGYPADRMSIAPRVRCDGCPRYPFVAMRLLQALGLLHRFPPHGRDEGYSDFEWVAIERKYDAPAIEPLGAKGWAWWELSSVDPHVGASRADLDALRLLAVFLAHWDNKAENQRLVCLDAPAEANQRCNQPLAMLQDLGATFGPPKANLARWREMPVWSDRRTCAVSMEHLPWNGATFPEARIGEAGRVRLARQLSAIPYLDLRALFRAARMPEYYSATGDEEDLDMWMAAFRHRADQITSTGPCPQ
jgi:hypothetical protein